jgi:hypothetical protein
LFIIKDGKRLDQDSNICNFTQTSLIENNSAWIGSSGGGVREARGLYLDDINRVLGSKMYYRRGLAIIGLCDSYYRLLGQVLFVI